MITVNMGGLSETLFESELFGHVKGAFTDAKTDRAGRFELADESTLFMDEIANIPLAQQAKLLRVIETGDFERVGSSKTLHANVRIISATNANLENEDRSGSFSAGPLVPSEYDSDRIAALRDRRDDIMPLANSFLHQHAERYRKQVGGFDEGSARTSAAASVSGKCSRARSYRRTRRADGARSTNLRRRSRLNEWRRRIARTLRR